MRKLITGIKNMILGLLTVGKHFTRHAVTLQYPTVRWEMPERSRGIVVLLTDKETGKLNCTSCMLCMRSCPSGAINIVSHKDEETKKRVLDDFVVNFHICCFCGMCQEACNFSAIKMAPKYEYSTENKDDLIWHMDKLQSEGLDVPYEKPVRKKPVAKKPPVKKPAAKPAEPKPEQKTADKPAEDMEKTDKTSANPNLAETKDDKKTDTAVTPDKKAESEPKTDPGKTDENAGGEEQK